MTEAALGLGVLVFAGLVAWVVLLAREQRIAPSVVRGLAVACAAGLLVMVLSDWPSEVLAKFWADHSVVAAMLSTVLLVGIVFLAFEDSERRNQEKLDDSVTGAGLGGMVDHVVDVEVALAMLSSPADPSSLGWSWSHDAKPLRWLREHRERLESVDGGPGPGDPRLFRVSLVEDGLRAEWRRQLVDQCIRRLLAGLRDWSPLIRGSRNGTAVLVAISDVRSDLMKLVGHLENGRQDAATEMTADLRRRLRLLALFMEEQSGAQQPRREVLLTLEPLGRPDDGAWRDLFATRFPLGPAWEKAMSEVHARLVGGHETS